MGRFLMMDNYITTTVLFVVYYPETDKFIEYDPPEDDHKYVDDPFLFGCPSGLTLSFYPIDGGPYGIEGDLYNFLVCEGIFNDVIMFRVCVRGGITSIDCATPYYWKDFE